MSAFATHARAPPRRAPAPRHAARRPSRRICSAAIVGAAALHRRWRARVSFLPASTRAEFRPMERARGGDYVGAARCFVEAFFLRKGNQPTASELAYLNGAQKKDLLRRYNQRGLGTMFVIKDERGDVVACVGAEVQTYKGTILCVARRTTRRVRWSTAPSSPTSRWLESRDARDSQKALMRRAIEEECKEWGFEEAVLVVEKNNREATSLYKKLGYRGIGGEPDTPNLVVNADGKVV